MIKDPQIQQSPRIDSTEFQIPVSNSIRSEELQLDEPSEYEGHGYSRSILNPGDLAEVAR
jgi:hypothetical protein